MSIGASSVLDIESSAGATLDSVTVTVTSGGIIEVDLAAAATLTLDGGTSVTGGTLTIGGSGTLDILGNAGATLDNVDVNNANAIDVGSHFSSAEFAIGGTVTLDGTGTLVLENSGDQIVGLSHGGGTLDNDSRLAGVGTIGNHLTLSNQGTIDADVANGTLTIDTGHSISNQGTLEAANGGTLDIQDGVTDSGAGYALVEGGTLTLAASANMGGPTEGVVFNNGTGIGTGTDYGKLILDDWQQFTGDISGFAGTQGNANDSDEIELVNFTGRNLTEQVSHSNDITTLTISTSNDSISLEFVGEYSKSEFTVKQVGSNVEIFDPPAAGSSSSFVSVGNDSFIFHAADGAGSGGSKSQDAMHELEHFTAAQIQQWSSLIGNDGHGDTFMGFVHHDDGAVLSANWHTALHGAFQLH